MACGFALELIYDREVCVFRVGKTEYLGPWSKVIVHCKSIGMLPVILLIRDMVVECWNRQHHSQTKHPIENLIPMNLFKILCVVTWA